VKRQVIPELLDSDAGTPIEIAGSLADLRMINRLWGGTSTTVKLLRKVAEKSGQREMSVLDVGGATGDVMVSGQQQLGEEGIRIQPTILDRAPSHLRPELPNLTGDALALPFPDASFDVVSSSLFLHHLEPAEVEAAMHEALRVCRLAVIVNDLVRSAIHLAFVYAGFALYRSRLTRFDSVASVKRAYTVDEMRTMLSQTGASRIEIARSYFFRMGVVAWK
jgi:ubiquinone/menaquinone biosynthesis C-methylase UbiE